jgi:hypothetical protein
MGHPRGAAEYAIAANLRRYATNPQPLSDAIYVILTIL